jgi:hypothetical protein
MEGSTIDFSLANAADASSVDQASLSYAYACSAAEPWRASSTASFSCPTTTYGTLTVRGKVVDKDGGLNEYSGVVQVTNVAPTVAAFAGTTILAGETYSASGSFTDAGTDPWTATVNYGDGAGTQTLALSGKQFSLSHAYLTGGSYTVTVTISDGRDARTQSATVLVQTPRQGVDQLTAMVAALAGNGTLEKGEATSLQAKLDAAGKQLLRRDKDKDPLDTFVNYLHVLVKTGRLDAATAAPLLDYAARVTESASA